MGYGKGARKTFESAENLLKEHHQKTTILFFHVSFGQGIGSVIFFIFAPPKLKAKMQIKAMYGKGCTLNQKITPVLIIAV